MEKAVVGRTVASVSWSRHSILAALLACAFVFVGAPAFAAERHYPYSDTGTPAIDDPINAEGNCYSCHTLDNAEGVNNTSYIQGSARTMGAVLAKNGGAAPDHLGCTYCHYSITSTTMMKEVLSHFGQQALQAPDRHQVHRRQRHRRRVLQHHRHRTP